MLDGHRMSGLASCVIWNGEIFVGTTSRFIAPDAVVSLLSQAIFACGERQKTELCAHLGVAGHDYDGKLMIVGRCLNGGVNGPSWPKRPETAEDAAALASECVRASETCPLSWVYENDNPSYNINRSTFWRVSRKLLSGLSGKEPAHWSSRLAWSNLYKIAPSEEGNPSDALCYAQLSKCAEILALEIEAFRPESIVFVTGEYWFKDFRKALCLTEEPNSPSKHVEARGSIRAGGHSAKYVVACRPEGKGDEAWTSDVLEALRGIDLS